ncbi:hypothetical protein [Ureibacillus sp. GCM10028918]|uniref:hypothetical protein n=1 Tax=Ureibacillus sp. GCM10028918 TaxID=3273429 RepID=UPI0036073C6B
MSSRSIYYYEDQFKEYIMKALVDRQLNSLKQVLEDLIRENQEDYKIINYAYLNVKREITGYNTDRSYEEDICERFKHI